MPASNTTGNLTTSNGSDADSQTELQIVRVNDTTLEARVIRGGREITAECPASAFNWTRVSGDTSADTTWNNAHTGMKQITLTADEIADCMQFACTYSETAGTYGTVQVNDSLVASHTPATADANDVFTIENGALKVTTSTTNGTDYALVNGVLSVNNGFSGTITSTATFNDEVQTKEIDFIYDHNGMRTGKIVSENGRVEITEYTLHGKLITHLTKRTVDENGDETLHELHFFYGANSQATMVEFENSIYRYVDTPLMDIVALIDGEGNTVVEYVYDTWGRLLSINGILKDSLGILNPIRYRGYVWDEDVGLYYLRSRMMTPQMMRFVSFDGAVESSAKIMLREQSGFRYCYNAPTVYFDCDGNIALTIGAALLTIAVAGITNVVSGLISSVFTEKLPSWGSVAKDFVKGAAVVSATICYGPLGGAAMAGAFGAAEYAYDCAENKDSPTLDGLKDAVVTDSITQLVVGGVPAIPTSVSAVKELTVDTLVGTFKEDVVSTTVQSVSDALEGPKNNSGAKTVKTSGASKSNQSQTGFGSKMAYLKTVRDAATGKLKEVVVNP